MSHKMKRNFSFKITVITFLTMFFCQNVFSQQDELSRFTISPFHFEAVSGEAVDAKRGTLLVAENRSSPSTRLIPINFIRFKSTAADPKSPIFYLAGGPGGSGIESATREFAFFELLRSVGDVIVFDQRGTGEADMSCPERIFLPIGKALAYTEVLSIFISETKKCKEYWEDRNFDLRGYTTVESAHDVNELRVALGIAKISLVGSSYGSHYALAILKQYESSVDRVVIAGVEGPDHSLSLPSSFDKHLDNINVLLQETPGLSDKIPNLREMLASVLRRLDQTPIVIPIENEHGGEEIDVYIGKFEVQLLMYSLLGRDRSIGSVPSLVFKMNKGEFSEVANMIYQLKTRGQSISAMLIMMDGASGASNERLAQLRTENESTVLGPVVHFLFPEIGLAWQAPDLGSDYRAPVESDRPVLIISGSMDARTPVSNGEEVARGLPNSQHLLIKGSGHPPSLLSIQDELIKFLTNEPLPSLIVEGPKINFSLIP